MSFIHIPEVSIMGLPACFHQQVEENTDIKSLTSDEIKKLTLDYTLPVTACIVSNRLGLISESCYATK